MQVDPRGAGPRVRRGFSGAGVVDERTDQVVGVLVATSSRTDPDCAWLTPVDTIAGYLSPVARLVAGEAAADPVFLASAQDRLAEVSGGGRRGGANEGMIRASHVVADWLRPADRGVVVNLVGPKAERVGVLAAFVALADPVSRRRLPADEVAVVPPGLMLPMRSVDLALDATGRTTAEVARKIAERIGIDAGAGDREFVPGVVAAAASMSLVIDSADEAATPDSLAHDLLGPLAERAPGRGGRLVLGSGGELLPEHTGEVVCVGE
ncbi:hypothetical protein FNH05_34305 [Amycolatopsis rhizosphaerae]|uniref:Uncharacterized protein n=1 Tax=Amycolatopsis rhizosphaerae TaxID=2053003 RepID=A0A558A947_9PSEU|nr:hypothetical protein [Amycolatopsis rhizosphaerae]TVT20785.1 hypothetical protein FNH05_34305 [Amycolatopsis rhizosphaerae]